MVPGSYFHPTVTPSQGDLLHQAATLACVGSSACTTLAHAMFTALSPRMGALGSTRGGVACRIRAWAGQRSRLPAGKVGRGSPSLSRLDLPGAGAELPNSVTEASPVKVRTQLSMPCFLMRSVTLRLPCAEPAALLLGIVHQMQLRVPTACLLHGMLPSWHDAY